MNAAASGDAQLRAFLEAATRELQSGNAASARSTLERAVVSEPKAPLLWFNLALAYRALRDDAAEMNALQRTLALDPYFFLALLQKAKLLERRGELKHAAGVYDAFLRCVPPAAQTSAAVQSAMTHAQQVIHANNAALAAFLAERTAAIRAQHDAARLDRAQECLDVLVGRKRIYVQQPTFMHFPRLSAIAFHDRNEFPWLPRVEAASDDIRAELNALFAKSVAGFVPYVANPEGAPLNQWRELNHSLRWSAYYLWREGAPVVEHLAACPKTAALLDSIPRADVPGHAPTAFFSILKPKTRIPPHTGVTNTRLVVHMPLVVPPGCGFRVGADVRQWQVGRAWVFDDTIEHEAWNDSEELRAILIFDIWHPQLSDAERDMIRAATVGLADYYGSDAPLSGKL